MRFLRIVLRAFGPFTDAPPIDLSPGNRGLHLIHGPNEAGKSSALRAIRCLLFGFPPRTSDDHLHKYDKLRIAAMIADEKGHSLDFVRRKREVNPLWTSDDERPIASEALDSFLGGLDREKFDDLFAMDHAELVAGGRSIIAGKGNLGSILFAAGSGLAQVDEVRKAIDAEMDDLFKPTGKNPTINAALADLKAAREASEAAMLATASWVDLDATLAREIARKAENDADRRRLDADKRRLERLRDALPAIARRKLTLAKLTAMGDVPVLSDGFADRRREATVDREAGIKARFVSAEALSANDRDLEAIGPPDRVLDEAEAIRRLRDDLGLYRKALEDRPAEQVRLARIEADVLALLAEIRPGGSLDDADALRVPSAVKEQVRVLAEDKVRIDGRCITAEAEVAKLASICPGRNQDSPVPDDPRLAEAMAVAVLRVQGMGDLEGHLASARADLARDERQAAVDLRTLPLWSGSLDDLEALAVPSSATLDRFDADFRAADEALRRAEADLEHAEADRIAIDRAIEGDPTGGPVPTEEELALRRATRDDGWRSIRRAWIEKEPVADPSKMADDFEVAVRSADDLADRFRREAHLVAEQAQRKLRRREILDRIAALSQTRDRAAKARESVGTGWADLWRLSGLVPLPPGEMKDWVAIRRADLVRQARAIRDHRADVELKAAKNEEYKADLGRQLARLGEPSDDPTEPLTALLGRARAAIDRSGAASRLQSARADLAKAEAGRDAWRIRWASAIGPLGLEADADPSQAHAALARLDDLAARLREGRDVRAKIEEYRRVEKQFERAVGSLVDRLAADAPDRIAKDASIEATARDLAIRLDRAGVNEGRREESLKRREEERAKLAEARNAVDRAEVALASLVREARLESSEGLIEAERASDDFKALKKDLRALDEQLATLAGPVAVDRLREEAEGVDPESLVTRIAEIADQLAPLDAERSRLDQEIGRCDQRLRQMDGGPAAADARQAVEEKIARLSADVERYARLRLASAVLREAVERYRKEHQGPVLDRAGALFADLTAGSFAGLRADVNDRKEPVLRGVRGDGTTMLDVEGMSEGTADQLYLALRLASLQTYLDDHESMPMIVDDILVNFDNARALAALKALADLSRRTQILFFTHHEHLIELARSSLGDDVLFVHRLTYPPVSVIVNGHPAEASPIDPVKPKRKKKATPMAGEA